MDLVDLTDQQIDDLTDLVNGALLVHQRSEAQWYIYMEGETASQVEGDDAALYLNRGWVERQGFESALNLEMYALTAVGYAAIEPHLEGEGGDEDDEDDAPAPYLLLSAAAAEDEGGVGDAGGLPGAADVGFLVAIPVDPYDVDLLRRRTVLAETLAAADDAFLTLEYEAELVVLDPRAHPDLGALLPDPSAHALVTELPDSWHVTAGVETRWASVLVSETGFSFAVGLENGRRLETGELAETALMEVAVTLLGADLSASHGPEASA